MIAVLDATGEGGKRPSSAFSERIEARRRRRRDARKTRARRQTDAG
ncbi:MAG TPA: hypothetical protein VF666_14080 [Pyrinomonadaceae bacterium]